MAVVVHVDLCTNRSGADNSTHQSRPHNPFLKDRTNGRQQSGRTAQHSTTKPTTKNKQETAATLKLKNTQTHKVTKRRVCADMRLVVKHAQQTSAKKKEVVATVNRQTRGEGRRTDTNHYHSANLC